jgi:hypothetical protein
MVIGPKRPFEISRVRRNKGTVSDEPALIAFPAPVSTGRLAKVTREGAVLNHAVGDIHPLVIDEHF